MYFRTMMACAAISMAAVAAAGAQTAEPPVAGKQIHFEKGYWSAVPQAGPDGKVRQCVLVAMRSRAGKAGKIDTRFSLVIGRGAGLAIGLADAEVPGEQLLDDQAEISINGGRSMPAVAFNVGPTNFAVHPGDAAGFLGALANATTLTLRSDGAGIDSGVITLDLPAEAAAWLKQCGEMFKIAIDRPTDPNAPELPTPRPRSPKIASGQPTAAGPAGIEDKQKISGWDASELRFADGAVAVCMIRRHYSVGPEPGARQLATFVMASRAKGMTMMFKDSSLKMPAAKPLEASLKIGGKPFAGFTAQAISADEIMLYPQHGAMLARALENGDAFNLKTPVVGIESAVTSGVVFWLRACARRNGIALEPVPKL